MPEPDRSAPPAEASAEREPVRGADGSGDREPLRSRDEESIGWGDERTDPSDDDDIARLLADRPPHHDRF